jgi:serine/threonine protein kinase
MSVRNGGRVLKSVRGLKIFTKGEIKRITRNNSHSLGRGGFGDVYKGALPDNTIVAVKNFMGIDGDRVEEFVKVVEIQTQMIHKNILKLIGCCMEADVPISVHEFAAKGSLRDILHGNKDQVLLLDLRLDIAVGAAEGLRYMHSGGIRHGDVRPDSIFLDEMLTPKISDFDLSQLLTTDGSFTMTVVGRISYIDPVFMNTGLLTKKSDVYSFGAVLLELITRKKNDHNDNCNLIIEYRKCYQIEKSGRAMFDKEIAVAEDISVLEEIGELAIECLKDDVQERPDMTEVTERLVMIRRDRRLMKTRYAR